VFFRDRRASSTTLDEHFARVNRSHCLPPARLQQKLLCLDLPDGSRPSIMCVVVRYGRSLCAGRQRSLDTRRRFRKAASAGTFPLFIDAPRSALRTSIERECATGPDRLNQSFSPGIDRRRRCTTRFPLDFPFRNAIACSSSFIPTRRIRRTREGRGIAQRLVADAAEEWETGCSQQQQTLKRAPR